MTDFVKTFLYKILQMTERLYEAVKLWSGTSNVSIQTDFSVFIYPKLSFPRISQSILSRFFWWTSFPRPYIMVRTTTEINICLLFNHKLTNNKPSVTVSIKYLGSQRFIYIFSEPIISTPGSQTRFPIFLCEPVECLKSINIRFTSSHFSPFKLLMKPYISQLLVKIELF